MESRKNYGVMKSVKIKKSAQYWAEYARDIYSGGKMHSRMSRKSCSSSLHEKLCMRFEFKRKMTRAEVETSTGESILRTWSEFTFLQLAKRRRRRPRLECGNLLPSDTRLSRRSSMP